MLLTALTMLAVAAGAVVQGSLGFGLALIAAPVLLLLNPALVPGPLLCAVFCVAVLMTRREWHDVQPRAIGWAVSGGVPGSLLGAWATVTVATDRMAVVLGFLVIGAVVMSAVGHRVRPSKVTLVGAGVLSGVMGTVLSMGGPPLALLYQNRPGGELRGTLAGYFTLATAVALGALAVVGNLGWPQLRLALPIIPAALAGYGLSVWIAPRLNKSVIRWAVLLLAGLAGVAIVFRNWS